MAQCLNLGLLNGGYTANSTLLTLGQTGLGTGCSLTGYGFLGMTSCSSFADQLAVITTGAILTDLARGGTSCFNIFGSNGMLTSKPYIMTIHIGRSGGCSSSGSKFTVRILQNSRNDFNGNIGNFIRTTTFTLCGLIGNSFRTSNRQNTTITGRIDVCTTNSGVDSACRCINGTIDFNKCVLLASGSSQTAGSIKNRNIILVACAAVATPLIQIVNDNANTITQNTVNAFFNIKLCAR